jgi:branched-chain amino acid transport system permease protein
MIQVLINGLVNGAILALTAISLTIIFSILRVPHFGLGGILTLGAFVAYFVVTLTGANFVVGIAVAAAAMAGFGVLVERVAFRRLRGAPEDASFVAAIGVLIVLENGAQLLWGSEIRSIAIPDSFRTVLAVPGLFYLPVMRLLIFVVATLAFAGLHVYVTATRTGKAMRAVAQDSLAARLLGIPIDRIAAYTFALGSGMAGLAGALIGATFSFNYATGSLAVVKAFVVVVLGGLGSVAGAIAGGFLLGIMDSVTLTYVTSEYQQLVSFTLLILALVLRPSGLFGLRKLRSDAPAA